MRILVTSSYSYHNELRLSPEAVEHPLLTTDVTGDVGQLIDEAFTSAALAEAFPGEPDTVHAEVRPVWSTEPAVAQISVTLSTRADGQQHSVSNRFERGPWIRSAQQAANQLRAEGTLGADDQAFQLLTALKSEADTANRLSLPPLQAPAITDQPLEALGVRQLGAGSLIPERPILVSERLVEDAVAQCESAGAVETGGAVLGKLIRLPQPLPQTSTRIVTVLTTILGDPRHMGDQTRFHISPEALIDAAQVANLRGMGESVLTIFHTHGWGCGECNQKSCPLAECFPSLQDYELQAMFPSKSLLLPIAGRKRGIRGKRPVLQIHAWRGGELKPIRWQQFTD